ncbi:hypothetical protein [Nonomuraea helvata]|uniref:Uncharacterized protein n=1 Tax=Nonomuraea helvata TaxID=37484 RepID=A0ABV5S8E4_9ACTN
MKRGAQVAGTFAANVVRCAVVGVILVNGTQQEVAEHREHCTECATITMQEAR